MDSASPSVTATSVVSSRKELETSPKVIPHAGSSSPPEKEATEAQNDIDQKSEDVADISGAAKPAPRQVGQDEVVSKQSQKHNALTRKEVEESIKEAEEKARKLERAFAKLNAPFKVSFEGSGNEINFQVIEAESGKILRKFPPPTAQSILDRMDVGKHNALLDESA